MFEKGNTYGKGGARPGAGRPSGVIRAMCAEAFDERIPLITGIADDPSAPAKDRLAALALLARYGLGTKDELDTGGGIINVNVIPMGSKQFKLAPELEKFAQ